ncbi:nucleotidyltransferase family protein [Paenibacillus antri]|uniref:Nucleotidyltransferase family protein n=1 Tax=Paenibacillus antri TaxID=2582848 RepID=A0A5R9GAI5_9BACL|nr:nucleotidyltransferase family protein [Paenibacillus antri]TLS52731.1 nucleotidyltransferase family protein [Paenibacillus antri]
MKVAGIYLAAGQSKRMGRPKLSLELSSGKRLGGAALLQLANCGLDPLVVVVRADDALDWLPEPPMGMSGWRTESCFTSTLGLSFSLRCGLNAVLPQNPDAVLVALADQPFIRASEVRRLVAALEREPGLHYAASGNRGEAMPPSLFSKAAFPALEQLDGDRGAKRIFDSPEFKGVVLEMRDPDYFLDTDTEADFLKTQSRWAEIDI